MTKKAYITMTVQVIVNTDRDFAAVSELVDDLDVTVSSSDDLTDVIDSEVIAIEVNDVK